MSQTMTHEPTQTPAAETLTPTAETKRFTVADIAIAGGLPESDRRLLDSTLRQVVNRLARIDAPIEAEISIKDRGSSDIKTTLEVWIHGLPRLVATSSLQDVRAALNDVSAKMVAQITESAERRESMNNRQHRDTIRS